ncbi:MAG: ATP-binding protein [Deltaproteobacteria bacterium]|nr:ATP-binding protein [Deltaproteobacteria bacterium]
MSVTVHTALYDAMESSILQVECSYTRGFSGLQLIGSNTDVCKGGLERARAVLEDLGVAVPQKRIVLNISPAHTRKDGSHFDLPFAAGLAALITGRTPGIDLGKWIFAAELGLDGRLRPVKGVISFALAAVSSQFTGVVVAEENLEEISVLNQLKVVNTKDLSALAFRHFKDVVEWIFSGEEKGALFSSTHTRPQEAKSSGEPNFCEPNFDDMILSPSTQSVALVAATGLHSILLHGAPGTGKSMFSARLTSIMPPMSREDHLESLKIHSSVLQKMPESLLGGRPPFRSPHHQSSASAIMGIPEQPGEISLAHGGILFLDEFPEFRRDIIEALREPLETGYVRVSRAKKKVVWNSKITLVAACNACPCGWLGSSLRRCTCPTSRILAYRRKLSGPILDRIDLHVNMLDQSLGKAEIFLQLQEKSTESLTQKLTEKVIHARHFGAKRNEKLGVLYNRDLKADHMIIASGLDTRQFKTLVDSCTPKYATRRSLIRSLRVARTLADLSNKDEIDRGHLLQAWSWLPSSATEDGISSSYGT